MLSSLKFLLRHFVFWLLLFLFFRILFVLTQLNKLNDATFFETIKLFYSGFRLDISTVCYSIVIPFVLLFVQLAANSIVIKKINLFFQAIFIFFAAGVGLANITVYKVWGTLINARAIAYVSQPKEIAASMSNMELFFSLSLWILIFLFFFFIIRFLFRQFGG